MVREIEATIREVVLGDLRRRGAVVGISGGIDSSVVAALCARALGAERVVGLLMPDRDSSSDALRLGRMLADQLGIEVVVEDIAEALAALGCYDRQLEAIRMVFPEYGEGWRCKLVLPSLLDGDRLNLARLTVADPEGTERSVPAAARGLPPDGGRHELQAAHAEDDRSTTTPIGSISPSRGTPNLARIRPGVLREAGRRRRRLQAHRPPLQDPGLRACRVPRASRSEIRARLPTTDTYSLAADAGGVLLRLALRGDGPVPVGRGPRRASTRGRPADRADRGAGRPRLPRHRGEATGQPIPPPRARRR